MNPRPPKTKREHLRRLVAGKQSWSEPLSAEEKAQGFLGWHERGYLPHCDRPGLTQFVTFRLADAMPASRRDEWQHLLKLAEFARSDAPRSGAVPQMTAVNAPPSGAQSIALPDRALREQRVKLEEYLDRGLGACHLRDPRIASWVEKALLHHHHVRFSILAWVVMPNHVHVLVEIWQTPLSKVLQNWKSIIAVEANRLLSRAGSFWQPEYWDHFMRNEEQLRKAVRYIENNPVKARLCESPADWLFSSGRFRDETTGELNLPV